MGATWETLMPVLSIRPAMAERGWQDLIVGDRMRVDEEFAPTVERSGFSRSEWGMIMTAVEFEVDGAGESARLVADTSRVDVVMPELDKVAERMGGRPTGSSGGGLGGGLVDSIRSSLGLGGGVDPARREEAVRLADQYARKLQERLEERGQWERVRDLAVEERDPSDDA